MSDSEKVCTVEKAWEVYGKAQEAAVSARVAYEEAGEGYKKACWGYMIRGGRCMSNY